MKSATLTVSSQGQITIPKAWRELLGLKKGKKLMASVVDWVKGKAIVIKKEPESWAEYLAGTGKGLWGKDSDEYHRKWKEEWD